jgi:hypothetical protein
MLAAWSSRRANPVDQAGKLAEYAAMSERPRRITICHMSEEDDYNPGRGRYVGTTEDERCFFVTTPFVSAMTPTNRAGRDYVALYLWSADGEFESASFVEVARRPEGAALPGNTLPAEAYDEGFRHMLEQLGEVTYGDIEVAPFAFELEGVTFGLVAQRPDDDDDGDWRVSAEPGDYMCWFPPWDGDYDT